MIQAVKKYFHGIYLLPGKDYGTISNIFYTNLQNELIEANWTEKIKAVSKEIRQIKVTPHIFTPITHFAKHVRGTSSSLHKILRKTSDVLIYFENDQILLDEEWTWNIWWLDRISRFPKASLFQL